MQESRPNGSLKHFPYSVVLNTGTFKIQKSMPLRNSLCLNI